VRGLRGEAAATATATRVLARKPPRRAVVGKDHAADEIVAIIIRLRGLVVRRRVLCASCVVRLRGKKVARVVVVSVKLSS
jgi:hypothetical protein